MTFWAVVAQDEKFIFFESKGISFGARSDIAVAGVGVVDVTIEHHVFEGEAAALTGQGHRRIIGLTSAIRIIAPFFRFIFSDIFQDMFTQTQP